MNRSDDAGVDNESGCWGTAPSLPWRVGAAELLGSFKEPSRLAPMMIDDYGGDNDDGDNDDDDDDVNGG